MRQILEELSDRIDEVLPDNYHHLLVVFPKGKGRVESVTTLEDMEELLARILTMAQKLKDGTANIEM